MCSSRTRCRWYRGPSSLSTTYSSDTFRRAALLALPFDPELKFYTFCWHHKAIQTDSFIARGILTSYWTCGYISSANHPATAIDAVEEAIGPSTIKLP